MVHRLFSYPKPLIAAATGHGLALGALWLLACDTRIGIHGDFKFGLTESAIGLALPVFGTELARARITSAELTASVVQSKIYDPKGAVTAGFLDQLVPKQDLLNSSKKLAERLTAIPDDAYAANKHGIRKSTLDIIVSSL